MKKQFMKPLVLSLLISLTNSLVADTPKGIEWPYEGHDLRSSNHNPTEKQISPANIQNIKVKWKNLGAAVTAGPIVRGNTVYYSDINGVVYARNANTGATIWENNIGTTIFGAAAVTDNLVFVASADATVHALDRTDGHVVWSKKLSDNPFGAIFSPLTTVENYVIALVTSAENFFEPTAPDGRYTSRGTIVALDVATGDIKWTFETTTATKDSAAGNGFFGSPAYNVNRKMMFIGTGQAFQRRPGPLTDALLALNYVTGQLVWSFSYNRHDVFGILFPNGTNGRGGDFDVASFPNLFSIGGIDLVGAMNKSGTYRVFEQATGNRVWQAQVRPPNTAGTLEGVPSATVDHARRIIVAAANSDPNNLLNPELIIKSVQGDLQADIDTVRAFQNGTFTYVTAFDARNGKVVWRKKVNGFTLSPLTSANGIVYQTCADGFIRAYNIETGTLLIKRAPAFPKVELTPGEEIRTPLVTLAALSEGRIFLGAGYFRPPLNGGFIVYDLPKA